METFESGIEIYIINFYISLVFSLCLFFYSTNSFLHKQKYSFHNFISLNMKIHGLCKNFRSTILFNKIRINFLLSVTHLGIHFTYYVTIKVLFQLLIVDIKYLFLCHISVWYQTLQLYFSVLYVSHFYKVMFNVYFGFSVYATSKFNYTVCINQNMNFILLLNFIYYFKIHRDTNHLKKLLKFSICNY